MFEIWAIEADGKRVLVRDDVAEGSLARALVSEGNNGAAIRGEPHRYIAVPDPDMVDTEAKVTTENVLVERAVVEADFQ
ncbi:hypothetical protein [Paraburkholderia terrae]|uniref:hypothetical protein n=1 Tax=Paraburkholderia terrae TaxID=311230 RepID=UPI001EE27AA4|nr:hypothetical protein [Paraburkholderia terrae]GJH04609.1 hypothetical protein CBA19C8_28650 [Paraburkholderia terrae]